MIDVIILERLEKVEKLASDTDKHLRELSQWAGGKLTNNTPEITFHDYVKLSTGEMWNQPNVIPNEAYQYFHNQLELAKKLLVEKDRVIKVLKNRIKDLEHPDQYTPGVCL